MIASQISSLQKTSTDRSLLQSLLPQVKPEKEFSDIFSSTQSQINEPRRAINERRDQPERLRADDSNRAGTTDDERSPTLKELKPERELSDTRARDGSSERESTQATDSEAVPNNEDDSAKSESGTAAGADSTVNAKISEESADSEEGAVSEVTDSEVIVGTVALEVGTTEETLLPGDVQAETINSGVPLTSEPGEVDEIMAAEVAASALANQTGVEKRDPLIPTVALPESSKGREAAAAALANSAVFKNTATTVDPSSQIIEVEQLFSEKAVASAALLKTPLGMAVKTEVLGLDADGARLAVNLSAKMESGLLSAGGDAKWLQDLTSSKLNDVATKLSSVSQTGIAAVDTQQVSSLTSPQLSQYQTNSLRAPNLPQGLQAAVGQPGWGQAVGDRVLMMAAKNLQVAEIQLDPPELGQLQVRIVMNHDQASVTFVSPQQSVREALDESAQRLRDMFDAEGVELVNVDVSDQSQSGSADDNDIEVTGDELDLEVVGEVRAQEIDLSLVDHYV